MKKRVVAGFLAAMMLLATGCGSSEGKSASNDTGKEEVPTIIWWNVGNLPENADEWEAEVNKYLEAEIGVKVDYRTIPWSDFGTKQNTIINSGEYFDIMFTEGMNYNQFVSTGAFADLTELLPKAAPELQEFIPAEVWQGVTNKEGIFGVPTYKDSARTSFYVFDKSYVDKYNIDYQSIDTMEELDTYFRTVKEGEGENFYPLQLTTAMPWNGLLENYDTLGTSMSVVGVKMGDENYEVVNVLEQEDIREGFNYLHTWYKDGIINPDANVQTEQNRQRPFFKAAGWPGAVSVWQKSEGVEEYVATKAFGPAYTTEAIQGSVNAISSNSKYKEEALKLLEFINTDHKARDMFAYGIEGVNFEYVEDNVVRPLDDAFSTMQTYAQASFFTMSTVEGAQKDQYEEIKAQNAEAVSTKLLGFTMDTSELTNEVSACRTIWDKYASDLMTGAVDPETVIPQMLDEMEAVGLEKIMTEAQKQVDEYVGK